MNWWRIGLYAGTFALGCLLLGLAINDGLAPWKMRLWLLAPLIVYLRALLPSRLALLGIALWACFAEPFYGLPFASLALPMLALGIGAGTRRQLWELLQQRACPWWLLLWNLLLVALVYLRLGFSAWPQGALVWLVDCLVSAPLVLLVSLFMQGSLIRANLLVPAETGRERSR